jgi:hypothetical protein
MAAKRKPKNISPLKHNINNPKEPQKKMRDSNAGGTLRATERLRHPHDNKPRAAASPTRAALANGARTLGAVLATGAGTLALGLTAVKLGSAAKGLYGRYMGTSAPKCEDYRAVVKSNSGATAHTLSSEQKRLVCALLEGHDIQDKTGDAGDLWRSDTSPYDVFHWGSNVPPEATLLRSVQGEVIAWTNGECMALPLTSARIKGNAFVRGTLTGYKEATPVCATIALALYQRFARDETGSYQAEALSDGKGGWLDSGPEVTVDSESVFCASPLKDGLTERLRIWSTVIAAAAVSEAANRGAHVQDTPILSATASTHAHVDCEVEVANYRAIANSKAIGESRTKLLEPLQKELLCEILQSDKSAITHEYASLTKSGTGFLWRPTAPDAMLLAARRGLIVVCIDGVCDVASSANVTTRIARKKLALPPECAALAIALRDRKATQAVALSDNNGRWLDVPATCALTEDGSGVECTYARNGATEKIAIEWSRFSEMSENEAWFEDLFGFPEVNFDVGQRKAKFRYHNVSGVLRSTERPGVQWDAGSFTTPTLAELRAQTPTSGTPIRTTVTFVSGDVAILHGDPKYAGAVFQAASQFNCLEFTSAAMTPEMGVAVYYYDKTQGPACAIACAPGTIVRNYFAFDGTTEQTSENQINTLEGVLTAIEGLANEKGLVTVENGYTFSTTDKLKRVSEIIAALSREVLQGLLRVGVQKDTQVTCTKLEQGGGWHRAIRKDPVRVTQVYASALSIKYSGLHQSDWEPLAELVLEAAYEATLRAALIHARPVGERKRVVLTALGGGVFGNDMNLIARVIVNAIRAFKTAGLDIVINEYREGEFTEIRSALLADNETKDLLVPQGQGHFGSDRRLPRPAVLYTE